MRSPETVMDTSILETSEISTNRRAGTETASSTSPNYPALLARAQERTYSVLPRVNLEERPLEPIEPEPFKSTPLGWAEYIIKRDEAREYEAEHSLSGVPFS